MKLTFGVVCVFCSFISAYSVSESVQKPVEKSFTEKRAQLRLDGAKWFPAEAMNMCAQDSIAKASASASKYEEIVAKHQGSRFSRTMAKAGMALCQVEGDSSQREDA